MQELPYIINKLNEELVYLLFFHAYVKEMHGSRSKIPSKKSRPYIHISRLRVNEIDIPADIRKRVPQKHKSKALTLKPTCSMKSRKIGVNIKGAETYKSLLEKY